MNKICQLLDFDADVLLFDKDTYIVSRFKGLISENFIQKFSNKVDNTNVTVLDNFKNIHINPVNLKAENISWQSSSEGINCQVFKVGSTGWQSGKLRIKVSTDIIHRLDHRQHDRLNITVVLEFYPDEPLEPESPLDDIRKMIQAT